MSARTALTATERRRIASRLTRPRRPRFAMLRLLWRQHSGALAVVLTLSAVAIGALVLADIFDRRFPARLWRSGLWQAYGPKYPDLAMQAIPLVAALFVGVRLISRELEDGTGRFAWTQGYGKARWALGKLAAAAAVLVPTAIAVGLVFGWWYRLYVPVTGYFTMHAFALYAPALVGWTLVGLSLGLAAAALTRREGRAMVLTLVGWVALHRFAVVGSPRTQPGELWPLQFVQLAILLAISGLLTGSVIVLIQGAPAIPGMPRLLRAVPRRAVPGVQPLARQLSRRRLLAVPRAAWRQHRIALVVALTLLGVYGATLLSTGLRLQSVPADRRPSYANPANPYLAGGLLPLVWLIGTFVGASLTGPDLDQGTVRFAWAQGVTITRWAASKLAAVGCVLVLAAAAVGLAFQWWDVPYLAQRLADPWFSLYAPVYAGWMALTLAAAAFLGVLTRSRTLAAVACLVGTAIAAGANDGFLRLHYLPVKVAINRPAPPGSLFVNWSLIHGKSLPNAIVGQTLQKFDNPASWPSIEQALTRYHATSILTYQPASQFWQLQAIEGAGLFALALVFGTGAVWVMRRQEP